MAHLTIRFEIANGRLRKLSRADGSEIAAFEIGKAPTEFLREFIAWNDNYNDDYAAVGRADLLGMVLDWYEVDLCRELKMYCDAQELPHESADELALRPGITDEQRAYLRDFGNRWDEMTTLYHILQRG